jgi:hypothetical protein
MTDPGQKRKCCGRPLPRWAEATESAPRHRDPEVPAPNCGKRDPKGIRASEVTSCTTEWLTSRFRVRTGPATPEGGEVGLMRTKAIAISPSAESWRQVTL